MTERLEQVYVAHVPMFDLYQIGTTTCKPSKKYFSNEKYSLNKYSRKVIVVSDYLSITDARNLRAYLHAQIEVNRVFSTFFTATTEQLDLIVGIVNSKILYKCKGKRDARISAEEVNIIASNIEQEKPKRIVVPF